LKVNQCRPDEVEKLQKLQISFEVRYDFLKSADVEPSTTEVEKDWCWFDDLSIRPHSVVIIDRYLLLISFGLAESIMPIVNALKKYGNTVKYLYNYIEIE